MEPNNAPLFVPRRPALPKEEEVGFFGSLGAAFRLENDVVNAVELMTRETYEAEDNFDLSKALKPYPHFLLNYPDAFTSMRSTAQVEAKVAQLHSEEEDKAVLARAGWAGVASMMVAGNLSPTMFIPLVGGSRGLKAVAEGLMLGAAGAGIQELPLQMAQETRTAGESLIGVASGAVLGGLIGGAISIMKPAERIAAEAGIVKTANAHYDEVVSKTGMANPPSEPAIPAPKVFEVKQADLDELRQPWVTYQKTPDYLIETKGELRPIVSAEDRFRFENTSTTLVKGTKVLEGDSPKFKELEQVINQRVQQEVLSGKAKNDAALTQRVAQDVISEAGYDAVRGKNFKNETVVRVFNKEKVKTESKSVEKAAEESVRPLYEAAIKSGHDHIKFPDGTVVRIADKQIVDLAERMIADAAITPPNVDSATKPVANLQPSASGAAPSRLPGAGKIKGLFGTEVGFGKLVRLSPVTRVLAQDLSEHAQWVQAQLSTAGLRLQGNAFGKVSAQYGTVENRIKGHTKKLHDALMAVDQAWLKYVYENAEKPKMAGIRSLPEARRQEKMSKTEFRKEISKAIWMEQDYVGPAPARDAAEVISRNFYDPFVKEALETGAIKQLSDIIDPRYINRVFDNEVVARNGPEFIRRMAAYYQRDLETRLAKAAQKHNEKLAKGEEIAGIYSADMATTTTLREAYLKELDDLVKSPLVSVDDEIKRLRQNTKEKGPDAPASYIEFVDGKPMERVAPFGTTNKEMIATLRETSGYKSFVGKRSFARRKLDTLKRIEGSSPEVRAKEAERIRGRLKEQELELREKFRVSGAENLDLAKGTADFAQVSVDRASELRHKILGTFNRLPAMEILQGERGPELMRMLAIPTEEIADFLETDIEKLLRTYTRTISSDIELTRTFGSADVSMDLRTIQEEIDAKMSAEPDEKKRQEIFLHGKEIMDDLTAQIGRLRHTWGIPNNPSGASARLARVMQNINTLRFMGTVLLSSVADPARLVMKYGLMSVMKDGVIPLITNFKTLKLSMREAQLAGVGFDVALHTRGFILADIMDPLGRTSKFEKGIEFATSKIGIVALFDYWTSAMKHIHAAVSNAQLCEAVKTFAETGDKGAREFLNSSGIDDLTARQIWDRLQSVNGGGNVNGVWVPNTESWPQDLVTKTYRAALAGEVDSGIITPGLERPLWMDSKSLGLKLVGQFRSFGMSSTQKTLMAGLQQRDMAFFNGTMISLALGAASYYLYATAAGGDIEKKMQNASLEHWFDEMITRSGILGVFADVQRIAERVPLTAGYANIDNIMNDKQGRVARQGGDDLLSALMGPSFDLANTASRIVTGLDDPTQAVIGQGFNLLPYQNVFWLRQILDSVEQATKSNFPERRQ